MSRTVDDLTLRELTEAAVVWFEAEPGALDHGIWQRYVDETMPPKLLPLLDRLEAAEAAVARVRAILDAWQAWDGSLGPDGRTHPDASSPRDRERLRAALAGDDEAGRVPEAAKTAPVSDLGPESGQGDHRDDEGRSGARDGSGS